MESRLIGLAGHSKGLINYLWWEASGELPDELPDQSVNSGIVVSWPKSPRDRPILSWS